MKVPGFASLVMFARSIGRIRRHTPVSLAAVAIAAGLAGCAAPGGPRSGDLECTSAQQCRVIVSVTCNPGCTASVDHPRVFSRGNDIVWIVDNKAGQSYAYRTPDGIFFKSAAGRDVFRCHREAARERYACMNRKDPGTYEYGIALDGSPPVPVLDPWVVN